MNSVIRNLIFYTIKPLVPRIIQLYIRKIIASRIREKHKNVWPILEQAGVAPAGWNGWPEKKQFALVLSHDVDTQRGHDKCRLLSDLETELCVRSAFNFVPERYNVSRSLQEELAAKGFEIGIHGLKHDGKLFRSWKAFSADAKKINEYIGQWKVEGFSSPSMMHNLDWMHALDILWDISTFDTDPFEPQPDGVCTILPFVVNNADSGKSFVELPYTLPQDFTIYEVLHETTIDIWKKKLDWVARHGGMALLNSHPDYMNFSNGKCAAEEYPSAFYNDFIRHIQTEYGGSYWHALPRDVARYCLRQQGIDPASPMITRKNTR
jgi:hypothetical protein